jgi:hypothetical protein
MGKEAEVAGDWGTEEAEAEVGDGVVWSVPWFLQLRLPSFSIPPAACIRPIGRPMSKGPSSLPVHDIPLLKFGLPPSR